MKKINLIWDELVRGGFTTSVCAVATLYSVSIILDKKVNIEFAIIAFLMTLTIYFFNFIGELEEDMRDKPTELRAIKKHRDTYYVLIFLIGASLLALILHYANFNSKIFALIFLLLGVLYTLGLKRLTTRITGFKDIFVMIAWNMLTPFFIIYHSYSFSWSIVFLMIFIITRDWININFSDLKDLSVDKKNNLKTYSCVLGRNVMILSMQWINVIGVIFIMAGVYFKLFPAIALVLISGITITAFWVNYAKHHHNYSTLLVDSEAYFWLVFLLIAKQIWI